MSTITGIQGQPLEITVVACSKLKDTEWFSRQDPYVCVEYGSSKFRTRTCTDGGKNPLFHEKFVVSLIEGLRELSVVVWNSNTLTFDDFIGSGKIQLHKVLSEGFDDSAWPLQTKTGRYAGEVKLILHYANAAHMRLASSHSPLPSAPPYLHSATPHVPFYANAAPPPPPPPPALATPYPAPYLMPGSAPSYPPPPTYIPNATSPYQPSAYPPSSPYPPQPSYPPTSAYPPSPYPPPAGYHHGVYPPPPY